METGREERELGRRGEGLGWGGGVGARVGCIVSFRFGLRFGLGFGLGWGLAGPLGVGQVRGARRVGVLHGMHKGQPPPIPQSLGAV